MEDLNEIIDDSLVIQRALAVKMILQGYTYGEIISLLGVSQAFIEKWRALYNKKGAKCFALGYKGSEGYLSEEQRKNVIDFIKSKQSCNLETLISYIQENFQISYKSKQSYYNLLDLAGMGWKKTEKTNPKKDEKKVMEKREDIKKNSSQEGEKHFPGIWSY